MKENKLVELSMDFSVDIINLVKFLKSNHETIIANCTRQVISTSQLSKHYPQNVLL